MEHSPTFVQKAINNAIESATQIAPKILTAFIFLMTATIMLKIVIRLMSSKLHRIQTISNQKRSVILFTRVFGWFAIVLATLSILGMNQLATTIGTASGFVALAVSYGLKDLISQLVSGLYLIENDDFIEGRKVTADGVTGIVVEIGIRQTKIESEDGDSIYMVANDKIETKWQLYDEIDENTHGGEEVPTE